MFYTNVSLNKNIITEYWIDDNGRRKKTTEKFKPSLAIINNNPDIKCDYEDIHGNPLALLPFDSCMDMYSWKKENSKYIEIFNDVGPIYEYMSNKYTEELNPDLSLLRIFNLDLECVSDTGFPYPETAEHPINSITVQDYYKDVYFVFGCGDYKVKEDNVKYFKCDDEFDLCSKFLEFFRKARPDIITGFNSEGFDIPYIINRFKQVLPRGEYYKLSPVQEIKPYKIDDNTSGYHIVGVSHLDFMKLYSLMNLKKLESYSLENIAQEELGEGKVNFKEQGYANHYDLFTRNFDLAIDYNIEDVRLVSKVNRKKRFIEIVLSQAFKAKVNFEDAIGSVKPWDMFVYNENKERKILASPKVNKPPFTIPGGFVLEPTPGFHDWLVVSDIASSYPHQIISGNLSPETLVDTSELPTELIEIQQEIQKQFWGTKSETSTGFIDIDNISHITTLLKKYNLCMSPNGEFFTTEKYGIFPQIVSKIYQERKDTKKKMKSYWEQMKTCDKDSDEYKTLEDKWAASDNTQYAIKIFMNRFYGVFANNYFRYSDPRLASAVTTGGQMCIKGPKKYIEDRLPLVSVDYIDTDSLFLNFSNVLKDRFKNYDDVPMEDKRQFCILYYKKIVSPIIEEYYTNYTTALNFVKNTFSMDFEVIADRTLTIGKKRYIMNLVYDDGDLLSERNSKLKVKGVEINRVNTPMVVRKRLEQLVKQIIKTGDNDKCLKYIDDFRKEFSKLEFHKIAKPTGVKLGSYKLGDNAIPIHVRAALVYNKSLEDLKLNTLTPVRDGEKIRYSYIKEPNIFNSNVIACIDELPEEISKHVEIDYNKQFDKACLSPMEIMFNVLEWKTEKVASLEDWF